MTQARIEQSLRADHVGDNEVLRSVDGPVDMGLSGEVDDHVVPGEHLVEQVPVADISMDEGVARVVGDGGEVRLVAGVGELVEHRHAGALVPEGVVGPGHQFANEMRADEARGPGDQVAH